MKIQLNREVLAKKLNVVGNVIPMKSTIPILDHALVTVIGDRIIFTGSDTEITVSSSMTFELVEGEVSNFVCDTNIILKTIVTLKSDTIWIEVSEKQLNFGDSKSRKKYTIPIYYSAENFPRMTNEFKEPISLNGDLVAQAIKITSPIVNKASLIPAFTGVFIGKVGDKLRFSGVTNQLFSVFEFPIDGEFEHILVSKDSVKVIAEFEKSPDVAMSVSTDSTMLCIDNGDVTAYCRLIDAKFPNIDSIIDQVDRSEYIKVDKVEFTSCVTRATLFQNRDSKTIKFDYSSAENFNISAENVDFAKQSIESLDYAERLGEMKFVSGFNSDFVQTVMRSLDGENILMSQNTFNKPMIISDDKTRTQSIYFLISPLLIKQD
ncbi:MAG: hypothetical protein ACK5B9_13350 [Flavobacteriia bacterium]|jgi:DNA polymerase-3 subunit beta